MRCRTVDSESLGIAYGDVRNMNCAGRNGGDGIRQRDKRHDSGRFSCPFSFRQITSCEMESVPTTNFCNPVIGRFGLNASWCRYLLVCVGITVFFRALQSLLKAQSFKFEIKNGDCEPTDLERQQPYWRIYRQQLFSFNFRKHSDLFLPTVIGFVELVAYPILFVIGQYIFIGAWLGIKTAGSWKGWQTSPTAYNRFLLFNLFNLLVAYIFLTRFIYRVPCP